MSSTDTPPKAPPPPRKEPMHPKISTHDRLSKLWDDPPGLLGKLMAVQNDAIGMRLVLTGFFFLLLGGSVDSFVMRLQLAQPEMSLIGDQLYSELFTNHGSVTMFLVILPIWEGFAIMILPLMLGTREMPFPRLGAFAYWTFLGGGLLYYSSTLFQLVPDAGWFAYTPLSGPEFSPDLAIDFWILGLGVAEIGALAAGAEIIIGILKLRAPGMTLSRIPLFAWAMLVTSFMILFAFTPLIVGSLLLELDRGFGTAFFDVSRGGSSLLWQHMFWIFGHPEVYIQFLPATGVVSAIIPIAARRRMVGYTWQVAALIGIGFLAFGLWAHHMFTTGIPPLVLTFFAAASMAIAIPAGVQIFAWLATLWHGKPRMNTSLLFVLGFIGLFVFGGITGVMTASVPFDLQAHDSYFVVGHLHYVLIGGVAFPMFAGIYHWWPKLTGKLLDERLGRWNFWLLFVGVNVAFFPMHIVGLLGMQRRIYTYEAGLGWGIWNLVSTIGVLIIGPGLAAFIWNIWRSWRGPANAGPDPWGGDTLEWAVDSPPTPHAWSLPPIVRSRNPVWDQEDLTTGDTRLEKFVRALGEWPLDWRAAVTVGTSDARPQEVYRISNPSLWPLIAAIGVVIIFGAEIIKWRWLAGVGALVTLGAAIGWNWPTEAPMSEEDELAFEREHGVPVHAGGSVVVSRWGIGLAMMFLGIVLGSMLLGYFYLRLDDAVWPPAGIAAPDPWSMVVPALLVLASGAAIRAAFNRVRRGDRTGQVVSQLVAGGLVAAAMWLQIGSISELGFSWTTTAYGSIFYTLNGLAMMVAGTGVLVTALNTIWALRGHHTPRRHVAVHNMARFWPALVGIWLVVYGVLHLAPALT